MSRTRRRVLGIDLGGARMGTTGVALLEGRGRPRVASAMKLPKAKTAERAERRLLELIEDALPDAVAIDAPLTLPPCLTCPPFCRGPARDLCELQAARDVWDAGGHPVTERLCEVRLRGELDSGPLPTVRIAQIAARGVTLARRILAGGTRLGAPGAVQVLEVYPYATLARLGRKDAELRPRNGGEDVEAFAERVLDRLSDDMDGIDDHLSALRDGHVLDSLVAAYTGWLATEGLEPPPPSFNQASGWIWLPRWPENA
jgi:predicted nuclease with RNAse H fold